MQRPLLSSSKWLYSFQIKPLFGVEITFNSRPLGAGWHGLSETPFEQWLAASLRGQTLMQMPSFLIGRLPPQMQSVLHTQHKNHLPL